jgi:hypothetical protein
MESNNMDIDNTSPNIDDLIGDFSKISFFSDSEEYSKLNNSQLLEITDFENEEDLNEILTDTLKRYESYKKNIVFTDETQHIFYLIQQYIRLYNNYKIQNEVLFEFMQKIDFEILELIHSSEKPRFWLN